MINQIYEAILSQKALNIEPQTLYLGREQIKSLKVCRLMRYRLSQAYTTPHLFNLPVIEVNMDNHIGVGIPIKGK